MRIKRNLETKNYSGVKTMLVALRHYQNSGAEDGDDCALAWLPGDVLRLVRNRVVYNHIGFEGCCRHGELEALRQCTSGGDKSESPTFDMLEAAWRQLETSESGHFEVMRYLLEEHEWDIDRAMRGCCRYGHLDMVPYLLEHGADLNDDDDYALRTASNAGHVEMVKYLVSKGSNVNAGYDSDFKDSALTLALNNGHSTIAKFLIKHGAKGQRRNCFDALQDILQSNDPRRIAAVMQTFQMQTAGLSFAFTLRNSEKEVLEKPEFRCGMFATYI